MGDGGAVGGDGGWGAADADATATAGGDASWGGGDAGGGGW
jgi:hypothetical protein